jgi:cyanate permease
VPHDANLVASSRNGAVYLLAALGFFLGGFLTSRFGAFLFAMLAVYADLSGVQEQRQFKSRKDVYGKSASTR